MSYSRSNQNRRYSKPREQREMHDAVCAECNQETQVPFKPDGERPVYCKDCYSKKRPQRKNRY